MIIIRLLFQYTQYCSKHSTCVLIYGSIGHPTHTCTLCPQFYKKSDSIWWWATGIMFPGIIWMLNLIFLFIDLFSIFLKEKKKEHFLAFHVVGLVDHFRVYNITPVSHWTTLWGMLEEKNESALLFIWVCSCGWSVAISGHLSRRGLCHSVAPVIV